MYHLNTFRWPKNEGVNEWAGEGRTQRNTKNIYINNISTLILPDNTLQNAMKVGIFLM